MNKFIKRLLDLILALMLFIPAALVLLFGVLFVRIVSPESSPIFKQERVGRTNLCPCDAGKVHAILYQSIHSVDRSVFRILR